MAVFLSGDGGWAGIDREIANTLAKNGVPVIGVDSLRYFWDARTPASTAADVARLIRFYMAQWHKSKILLIGYSQGADVLPFVVNRLPPDARAQIGLTAMLALGRKADFQFRLSNWLKNSNDGLPIAPEVERLGAGKFLCVYGSEETDSGCPAADVGGIKSVKLNGGHHFDGDNAGLARRILNAAR
jgi:type IV secretory pathway VirJ component